MVTDVTTAVAMESRPAYDLGVGGVQRPHVKCLWRLVKE